MPAQAPPPVFRDPHHCRCHLFGAWAEGLSSTLRVLAISLRDLSGGEGERVLIVHPPILWVGYWAADSLLDMYCMIPMQD
jgi:hypothetical protein